MKKHKTYEAYIMDKVNSAEELEFELRQTQIALANMQQANKELELQIRNQTEAKPTTLITLGLVYRAEDLSTYNKYEEGQKKQIIEQTEKIRKGAIDSFIYQYRRVGINEFEYNHILELLGRKVYQDVYLDSSNQLQVNNFQISPNKYYIDKGECRKQVVKLLDELIASWDKEKNNENATPKEN